MSELLNPERNNLFAKAAVIAGCAALSLLVASRAAEVVVDWRKAYMRDANEADEAADEALELGGIQHAA
jgi:hypothetical protein